MTRAFASVWSLVDFLARRLGLRPATTPHNGFRSPPAAAAAPRRIMTGRALERVALDI
jgi:hypothetical protein